MSIPERRRRVIAHVAAVRAATFCHVCGKQPIEWHRAEHDAQPHRRIGTLVQNNADAATVDAEIALCTALCHRCHSLLTHGGSLTHCRSGHLRTPENTGVKASGYTYCKDCNRIAGRLRRALHK